MEAFESWAPQKRVQAKVQENRREDPKTEPGRFIVRTRGQSPLKKGDVIAVDVRS